MELNEKRRKPNFSETEKILLIEEFRKREDILKGSFSQKITSRQKHSAWEEIANELNCRNPSVKRTVPEIQKKWQNLNSSAKAAAGKRRKEMRKTGKNMNISNCLFAYFVDIIFFETPNDIFLSFFFIWVCKE